jgi:hypothetical protein
VLSASMRRTRLVEFAGPRRRCNSSPLALPRFRNEEVQISALSLVCLARGVTACDAREQADPVGANCAAQTEPVTQGEKLRLAAVAVNALCDW